MRLTVRPRAIHGGSVVALAPVTVILVSLAPAPSPSPRARDGLLLPSQAEREAQRSCQQVAAEGAPIVLLVVFTLVDRPRPLRSRADPSDAPSALLTDLYELTMAASYHARGMDRRATFDLFVRELPRQRSFLVAAGLEQVLAYLESLHFREEDVAYLRSLGLFREPFLDRLRELRFTGDVWAIPEGEVVFPPEPILRVTAPLIEAQVVETYLLNIVNFETMVTSKAARIAIACAGRPFVDFSPRRDHGPGAALLAARAAFIGGASATSNVLAGQRFGIPVTGTMAHSYVMAFEDELAAFRAFVRDLPRATTLLIDTFDTERGARRAAEVAREAAAEGLRVDGVRLDSGDLGTLSRSVRAILNGAGLPTVRIFASGDLDEYRIAQLVTSGAPVDAFGVGTQLGTSADAPYLGGVYKLVADERGPKMKTSTGKATLPGIKQVYRVGALGRAQHDVVALAEERGHEGRPLLTSVMARGLRTGAAEPLPHLQERRRSAVASLPERLRSLAPTAEPYEVRPSAALDALRQRMTEALAPRRGSPSSLS